MIAARVRAAASLPPGSSDPRRACYCFPEGVGESQVAQGSLRLVGTLRVGGFLSRDVGEPLFPRRARLATNAGVPRSVPTKSPP